MGLEGIGGTIDRAGGGSSNPLVPVVGLIGSSWWLCVTVGFPRG